jgi:hypothetical protein
VEPAYLIQRVREALAREEGELGVRVEIVRDAILLRGIVASEARRARLLEVVREACDGESPQNMYRVVNELCVQPLAAPETPEALS